MPRFADLLFAMVLLNAGVPASAAEGAEGGYWSTLEWQHRPLLMVIGTGKRAEKQAREWEARLLASRCALAERRIQWLVVRNGGVWRRFAGDDAARFEHTRLDEAAARSVRRQVLRRSDGSARLLLFGFDGERKYIGQPRSLDTIWSLIDRMPMRRAELERRPDRCQPR